MAKKRIAIIGANDFQNQAILKAKALGYETHVFAWKSGDVGETTADYFYPISITEKEEILERCKEIKPDGILSIASDLAVVTVNYVAENLGLVSNGIDNTDKTTNKAVMYTCLRDQQVPTPKFTTVSTVESFSPEGLTLPLIVKPTDRSGSRGVNKVERLDDIDNALTEAFEQSFEGRAIVQEFVEGCEYSIEGLSWQGKHHILAMTKKETTQSPHFIEVAHVQPAYDLDDETKEKITKCVVRALDALEVEYGASHTELIIDHDGNVQIVEVGARMGGDCIGSDLVQLSTGYDFVKMVIEVACNIEPEISPNKDDYFSMVRFIFGEEDINKLRQVEERFPQYLKRVSNIAEIDNRVIGDSSTRYGYYLMQFDSFEQLNEAVGFING